MMHEDPTSLIADVIKSLGKLHAFALVGAGSSAAAVLRVMLQSPMLANFCSLHNPVAEGPATAYALVLQPTLIVQTAANRRNSEHGRIVNALTAKTLAAALPRGVLVERGIREADEADFAKVVAGRTLRLFQENGWRAHLPDLGTTNTLPRLSRVAGGLQAWLATAEATRAAQDHDHK